MDWNNINTDKDTSGLGPIEYDQSKVPALVRKHADNVRGKSYGQQVREAQARNAEYAGLIASESMSVASNADLLSKDTQNRFKDQIEGTTNSDEVIDARRRFGEDRVFKTVGERLEHERKIRIQVSINILDMVVEPQAVTDWIPVINEAVKLAYDMGGVNVFFPKFTYTVKPTPMNYITLRDGVNFIGGVGAVIKVSDNNPDFFYLMTGYDGQLNGFTMDGLTVDTNAKNQTSSVLIADNNKKRIIFRVELASDLRFFNNRFFYSGVNAIITTGAMYGYRTNIIAHNYFKFTNQSDTTYDNTAVFVGQIGHEIVTNIFESDITTGITARTAIETHSTYGVVTNNITNHYMYGVLALGRDYQSTNPVDDITPKNISDNVIMNCLGGILMWSSVKSMGHVTVNNNTIYINHFTRNRFSDGYYGVALDHNAGGHASDNAVYDVLISGNNIKFEESPGWLTSSVMPGTSNYSFEGAFAIGARTGLGKSFNLENVSVVNNTIINSPRMPFAFANYGNGLYSNIVVEGNSIFNAVNQKMIDIKLKSGMYLDGKIEDVTYRNNTFTDNRDTPYIVTELGLPLGFAGIKNLHVSGNEFNQKVGTTGKAELRPTALKGDNWKIPRGKHFTYYDYTYLEGENFDWGDIITLGLAYSDRNTFVVTSAGSIRSMSLAGQWMIEGNVLKVPSSIDIRTLYPKNFLKITKPDGSTLINQVKTLGVDYVNGEILISINSTYTGAVNVTFSKPVISGSLSNAF